MRAIPKIVVLVALVGAGCSAEGPSADPAPTPTTARITEDLDERTGRQRLLTESEITAVDGAPQDIEGVDPEELPVYENPDPRGPCGAELDQPRAGDADVAMFRAEGVLITETLLEIEPAQAERVVSDFRDDIDPGCPPFTSQTPTSAVQRTEFLHEVELPADLDEAVAVMSIVHVDGGFPLQTGSAMFHRDGTLGVLVMGSGVEIPDEVFRALTEAALEKL